MTRPLAGQKAIEGMRERVRETNVTSSDITHVPLHIGEHKGIGQVKQDVARRLARLSSFESEADGKSLRLKQTLVDATFEDRTNAVAEDLHILRESGLVPGWRDEPFPVVTSFTAEPLLNVERAAVSVLGLKGYGVHLNGYVTREDGTQELWVARRASEKPTWPRMLDHLAAGGQPAGIGVKANIVKELGEEAGVPERIANQAKAVSAVSYSTEFEGGLKRDVLFVFDLELPGDFKPVNSKEDGEVESFQLWPMEKVIDTVAFSREYKPNCALVLSDFLCRHGHVDPDAEGFLDLLSSLRSGDCS